MEKMKVLLFKVGKEAEVVEIDHTLEEMQRLVGGSIDGIYPYNDPVALICNEEGKLCGLASNCVLYDEKTGEPYDIIAGDFFVCGIGKSNFTSIPDDLIDKYMQILSWRI